MSSARAGIDSAALWGPVARSGIGRPAAHSRDELAAAAVAIADTGGLAAVSMRRVAAAVGGSAMSLYSYVADRDTLIELMIDQVGGEVALTAPTGDPLADLGAYARAQRAVMRRHFWLPAALAARQTIGPHALAGMDHVLAILADTDLDTAAKLEVLALLTGFVANYALYELAQVELARRTGRPAAESAAAEGAYLLAAARSGQYPHLAREFARANATPARARPVDPDLVFDRLLRRIIGGLVG
jgi:AcrR family transcriptional regulator